MATLILQNGYVGYKEIVDAVLAHGKWRSPRGQRTLDMGLTVISLASPYHALPVGQGRGLNTAIGAAEAAQLVGAFSSPELMTQVSPNFSRFLNSQGRFHGAYGTRVREQVGCAIKKLRDDPDTRQAVITLWDPWLDNLPGEADYPCTVGFQFSLSPRDHLLCMNVIMRSSDVWLGIPYDLFQFTQLQLTVARVLGARPGPFTLTTWSLHMYERDIVNAQTLTGPDTSNTLGDHNMYALLVPSGFGAPGDDITTCQNRARLVVAAAASRGKCVALPDGGFTESEEWYRRRLATVLQPEPAVTDAAA